MAEKGWYVRQFKEGCAEACACAITDDPAFPVRLTDWLQVHGLEQIPKLSNASVSKQAIGLAVTRGMQLVEQFVDRLVKCDGPMDEYVVNGLQLHGPVTAPYDNFHRMLKQQDSRCPIFRRSYSLELEKFLMTYVGDMVFDHRWWKANAKEVRRLVGNVRTVSNVMKA